MAEDKVRRGEVGSGCMYQNEDTTKPKGKTERAE